jgi:hypothetical protein
VVEVSIIIGMLVPVVLVAVELVMIEVVSVQLEGSPAYVVVANVAVGPQLSAGVEKLSPSPSKGQLESMRLTSS